MASEYIILKQIPGEHWQELGYHKGDSAKAAIQELAESEGSYVAVPKRSWKPAYLRIQTVKRKMWEENAPDSQDE